MTDTANEARKSFQDALDELRIDVIRLAALTTEEVTRFISPTKTPEYLAAGRPVVSTSIADVVRPYGERGMVRIADTPESFVAAIAAAKQLFA